MSTFIIERIKLLYKLLSNSACDINAIQDMYRNNDIHVLKRQVYRDLAYLEKNFLTEDERLIRTPLNDKKSNWYIAKKEIEKKIDSTNWYLLSFLNGFAPNFANKVVRNEVLLTVENAMLGFYDNALELKNRLNCSIIDNNSILNTYHLQKKLYTNKISNFKSLYWSIVNRQKVEITQIDFDVNANNIESIPFIFSPLRFIVHHSNISIVGFTSTNQMIILSLDTVKSFNILKTRIRNHAKLILRIEQDLSKRFGIAANINDTIYDIELKLDLKLARRLINCVIHSSQLFTLQKNAGFLKLRCGINQELIDWIFSLHTQVIIIKPQKLKEIYLSFISVMQENVYKSKDDTLKLLNTI